MVRVRLAAITPLDRLAASGRLGFTGVLGHRFVGVVEDASRLTDAQRAALARRRVAVWPGTACGHCDLCRGGLSAHCRVRTAPGLSGRDGGMAEFACVPAAALCPLPDHVDDTLALLAVPLAMAAHAGSVLPRRADAFITVLGDCELGVLAALVHARTNPRVRLLARQPSILALADRWGVKSRPIDQAGRRADQDGVLECSGTPAALAEATRFVRPRGTIVLTCEAALATSGAQTASAQDGLDLSRISAGEFGVLGARGSGIAEGVRLLAERSVDPAGLITRRVRLDDAAGELARSIGDNRGEWLAPVAVELS
jgi:threonine dehydrogenase-like Zn-dependent dehydrogenase